MTRKPGRDVINAASKKLDPREVLQAIINETPALHEAVEKDYDKIFKEVR